MGMTQTTAKSKLSQKAKLVTTRCILLLLLFSMSSVFAIQEIGSLDSTALPAEKIYIHLNKSYFTAGEDLWFKVYLVDGYTHKPSVLSEVFYVELIDSNNKVISKRTLKTVNGSAAGDFKLSSKLVGGTYTIRGYTNYMRNFEEGLFYQKDIFINTFNSSEVLLDTLKTTPDTSSLDVQFFPEGGYLINGFLNPIAFKALDSHGNSIAISGKLIDDTGRVIKNFNTAHLGMGLFHFIPKKGKTYSAVILYGNGEQRFILPTALNSGVLMTVSEQPEHYKIELRATSDVKIKDYSLLGKQSNLTVLSVAVNANKQENTTVIKLAKDILEEGSLELTLLNQENRPIAERLLYHENENAIQQASFTNSKSFYGQRELIAMDLEISSEITTDMSLSVTNVAVNPSEIHTTDIKTHLLLSSVLKGEIEQPGYYFYSKDIDRQKNLDILMRTQGWRQYVLDEEIAKSANYFLPEKGIYLSGKVVSSFNENEALIGSIQLTSNNTEEMIQDKAETNAEGTFSFTNLNFTDSTNVLLSANVNYTNRKRKKTANYKIILDSAKSPAFNTPKQKFKAIEQYSAAHEEAQDNSISFLNTNKTIVLDEAFIAAKKKPKALDKFQKKRQGMPYREPSQTVDFEGLDIPLYNPLSALQGRIPGLSVIGSEIYLRGASSLTGSNAAFILVDGIPFSGANILLATQIDFIDVIKGPRAAIYGSRAANGVIAIFTKNGTESSVENKERGGSLNIEHPGYASTRKFYEPKYGSNPPKSKEIDNRTTLHWQPYIQLNNEGKTSISFYSGDVLGDYQVTLEGITTEGVPIKSTTTFNVE